MSSKFMQRLVVAVFAVFSFSLVAVAAGAEPVKLPVPRPAMGAVGASKTDNGDKAAKIIVPPPPATPKAYGYGTIVVMRGLGNIFSRGMDKLAAEMKPYGLPVTLVNHSRWQSIADGLIADYKAKKTNILPIILIGHSLGADASLVMANWLSHNGVPVRLVVAFDGVADISPVTNPVQEVINYYKPTGYGKKVVGAPNFKGTITNIDFTARQDIDHLTIDKDQTLQQETLVKVLDIMKKKPTLTAKN